MVSSRANARQPVSQHGHSIHQMLRRVPSHSRTQTRAIPRNQADAPPTRGRSIPSRFNESKVTLFLQTETNGGVRLQLSKQDPLGKRPCPGWRDGTATRRENNQQFTREVCRVHERPSALASSILDQIRNNEQRRHSTRRNAHKSKTPALEGIKNAVLALAPTPPQSRRVDEPRDCVLGFEQQPLFPWALINKSP